MADVARVSCIWSGFSGAPGYTKFSFDGVTDNASALAAGNKAHAFFNALTGFLSTSWSISFDPVVEMYDIGTGVLSATFNMGTPPTAVAGSVSPTGGYVGGTGAYITWTTGLIFAGRRVRGRTYVVPLMAAPEPDGTLRATVVTAVQTAAAALIGGTGPVFAVWSRQYNTAVPPVQVGGALSDVSGYVVPDKTGILRSRRD